MNKLENYGVSERYLTEANTYPEYKLARVVAQYSEKYKIVTENEELLAEVSGKFRYNTKDLPQYPVVGDCVMVTIEDKLSIIHKVLTRKSLFLRKAVGVSCQAQPVAANIDIVFLCMSLNQNYSLNRMERYLSIAWDSKATPVIVLTKSDLCNNLSQAICDIERISCFSDIITISMFDDNICEKFARYFEKNQTCTFIGSSGVGKSTLINRLLGSDVIATQEIGKGDKGRHTTTNRELFPCPLGGVVIDTPGMREFGVESADLSQSFKDIEELSIHCKFRDCAHTNEPGCAVLKAVENGTLDKRRLDNYHKLENENSYDGLNSKQIEIKKYERMFKEVGGIKNAKKFAKEKGKRKYTK